MNSTSCKLHAGLGLASLVMLMLPAAAFAQPFHVPCQTGGDQMGFAIAANGDFNGDGVNDIAVGAPCTFARLHPKAGRVVVLDGRNGKKLFTKRGSQDGQWMGAAVSFIRDVNGDGRDELAVGSPGYDVTPYDQRDPLVRTKDQAGRVDVWQRRKRRMVVFGTNAHSGFGEKIQPLNDVNDDGKHDFVVSASTDSLPDGRSQPGRVWIVSGRNGDFLGFKVGPKAGKNYGRSLSAAEDIDGDGVTDFLVGSDEVNIFQVRRAGVVDLVSPTNLDEELFRVVGARRDGIGKSIDYAGDVQNDGIKDFIAGSDGSDDTGVRLSGLVTLFGVDGERHWVKADTEVQEGARFGDAVATIGDIDGDLVTDFAAAASQFDIFVNELKAPDAGRVVTLSGVDGSQIWELEGDRREEQFGWALEGGLDFNLDEVPDVLVGTLGDAPFGRRGAGTVRILSGVNGEELFRFAGRRGLETRIVTALPETPTRARLRSFNRNGRRLEMDTVALNGIQLGELDVTVLNDRGANVPAPKAVQAAISTGHGSTDSTVEVYRLGRRDKLVDRFRVFPIEVQSGAECDGGEIDQEINEDLVCAQSDSTDGNVVVRIFKRLDEEDPFFIIDEFQAFASTDVYNEFIPINAGGATVAVGDVVGGNEDEIVVGTTRGVPIVKVFNREGALLSQFLAYDPVEFSGVDVAVIDLAGSGDKRIVTAPRQGNALIKVFDDQGNRVTFGRDDDLISILARPVSYTGGARVAAADVDLDERQEILVLIPRPEGGHEVLAYEGTNLPVKRFREFNPTPGAEEGGSIAGTDRFVRN
ncbi:MAG TPA: integrin alpha [Candidatus Limnocylindrales bacterium]|nr:integrin alpha [Candidatus Limnocylindrales bacterium]